LLIYTRYFFSGRAILTYKDEFVAHSFVSDLLAIMDKLDNRSSPASESPLTIQQFNHKQSFA
jgi:hypothetical protein